MSKTFFYLLFIWYIPVEYDLENQSFANQVEYSLTSWDSDNDDNNNNDNNNDNDNDNYYYVDDKCSWIVFMFVLISLVIFFIYSIFHIAN